MMLDLDVDDGPFLRWLRGEGDAPRTLLVFAHPTTKPSGRAPYWPASITFACFAPPMAHPPTDAGGATRRARRRRRTQRSAIGIRWTLGDVAPEGFEAMRLAAWGAYRVFGPEAGYTIVVNSMDVDEARERVGEVPDAVRWMAASGRMPAWLAPHVDEGLAEGKAWKFDPLRIYPDRWEIAFDNDCILWRMPHSIRRWLDEGDRARCLIAADVVAMHGRFSRPGDEGEPRSGGIRGIPPGFDLEARSPPSWTNIPG